MSKRQLTEAEWSAVFAARCQSKQGRPISPTERTLCDAAFKSDKERYIAMAADVFDATVPFGSTARYRGRR